VIDASALIAAVEREPGGEVVEPLLASATMSSLNFSEVLEHAARRGIDVREERSNVEATGLTLVAFDAAQAEIAAAMAPVTRTAGLSLADRACLALARSLGLPAITADRAWGGVSVGVSIELIR
jgi:ribonuclease VapC